MGQSRFLCATLLILFMLIITYAYFIYAYAIDSYFFYNCRLRRGNRCNRGSFGKMGAHVALKVEVGQLLTAGKLEQRRQLGVSIDATSVGGVLQLVGSDVSVDFTGHFSARHLSAGSLSEKGRKLITDKSGLDKTAGRTVTGLALALVARLGRGLEFTRRLLLERAELGLEGGDERTKLLQLGHKLGELAGNRDGFNGSNICNFGGSSNNRGS